MQEIHPLLSLNPIDIYLGSDFCQIKKIDGLFCQIQENKYLDQLRQQCHEFQKKSGIAEFTIVFEGAQFRVTAMTDINDQSFFILSRSGSEIKKLESIGLPTYVIEELLRPNLTGLTLIVGGMGVGKTTTVSSIIARRLEEHGGIALTIEDPPELDLNRMFGSGRCIQVKVSRQREGYHEQLQRSLRSRANQFLIGEIRDPATAIELLRVSANGWPIFTTMHAESIGQALAKLQALCRGMDTAEEALNGILADAISIVIWQKMQHLSSSDNNPVKKIITRTLLLNGDDRFSIRAKIRKGEFSSLNQLVHTQQNRAVWN